MSTIFYLFRAPHNMHTSMNTSMTHVLKGFKTKHPGVRIHKVCVFKSFDPFSLSVSQWWVSSLLELDEKERRVGQCHWECLTLSSKMGLKPVPPNTLPQHHHGLHRISFMRLTSNTTTIITLSKTMSRKFLKDRVERKWAFPSTWTQSWTELITIYNESYETAWKLGWRSTTVSINSSCLSVSQPSSNRQCSKV